MPHRLSTIGLLVLALAAVPLAAAPAAAQSDQHKQQTQVPPPGSTPAPFDGQLERLSEILGALQFLRGICGAKEGQEWRDEMQALIDAETPTGPRRSRMVAAFNRGYRGFQQTYRTCTPAAEYAIRRYLEEGSRVAHDITSRFAN